MGTREQLKQGLISKDLARVKNKKKQRKFPIFLHPKKLEFKLKNLGVQNELIIPSQNDFLKYIEREDIYSGLRIATFENPENGLVYFIYPGNRIIDNSSKIITLETDRLVKNTRDLRIKTYHKKYANGTFPTGTFCSSITGYDSSKRLTQIINNNLRLKEGDIFKFYSENINAEKQENSDTQRRPPSSAINW